MWVRVGELGKQNKTKKYYYCGKHSTYSRLPTKHYYKIAHGCQAGPLKECVTSPYMITNIKVKLEDPGEFVFLSPLIIKIAGFFQNYFMP
jgi:hypothetical protein